MADGNGEREPIAPSRALVGPIGPVESSRGPRPLAGFAAQLIACAQGFAPYRRRRRAEPSRALEAYAGRAPPPRARFEQRL